MHLDEFLYNIHFETEKELSNNHHVNWEERPLPYKLYQNLPSVPLCSEVPFSLESTFKTRPTLSSISHFLWYTFGITQFADISMEQMYVQRRFVPSGGALYPNELYIYLKMDDIPHGVYHYDVAHHRLLLVREGDFDAYLHLALGSRCEIEKTFGTVFISTMFWKNFFKYKNFSYRLQGLDTGALIGQLLEVAKRYQFESTVYVQFLDEAINHLLGLSTKEESVYAVIPLSQDASIKWFIQPKNLITATQLSQQVRKINHCYSIGSERIEEYPMVVKANTASLMEQMNLVREITNERNRIETNEFHPLPSVSGRIYDFSLACRKRYSPEMDFVLKEITEQQLAYLFQEATRSFEYRNDLDCLARNQQPRVSIYACLYRVKGVRNGAYYYDEQKHRLVKIRAGDQRGELQLAMTLDNVNLQQIPVCIHIVGEKEYKKQLLGYRGYRIQQMEAGMLLQRLLLAASSIGLGGHPLLGYDANRCDNLYTLHAKRQTTLIQLPIGTHYNRAWLQGGMHS
jgi:SagB-type dehydrogenase family enzyme